MTEIKGKAMELCKICSSFDLVQECKSLINQLQIESSPFRNAEKKL